MAANVVALGAVIALVVAPGGASTRPAGDAVPVEVTGVVERAWYPDGVVVVEDSGRPVTLDAAAERELAGLVGRRVEVDGELASPRADAPRLMAVRARAVDESVPGEVPERLPAVLPDGTVSGVVEVDPPAAGGASLLVDGRQVAASASGGTLRWDTSGTGDGRHLVTLLVRREDGALAAARGWVTVANGTGPPEELPGEVVFRGDFETGDLTQWGVVQSVGPRALRVVTSPVRQGRYAARVAVRQGDDPIDSVGDRSEVSDTTGESEGVERWYSWSTLFAPSFPSVDTWQVVAQWHSASDGSPPVGLYAQGDRLILQVNRFDGPGEALSTEFPWSGPLERGRWRDIVMRVRWSGGDESGLIQMWVDGVEVLPPFAIRTLYPGEDAYMKMGYYRDGEIGPEGVLYHDGLVITQTAP